MPRTDRMTGPRLIFAAVFACAALAFASATRLDVLLFNPSNSVPSGLYVRHDEPIARGAFVTVRALDVAPSYATARGFADPGDRVLKRVAAEAGDRVCAMGARLTINGVPAATRQSHDNAGRKLPRWSGCRSLAEEEVFLLGDTDDSFDGRYWGPTPRRHIEGVWRPLRR